MDFNPNDIKKIAHLARIQTYEKDIEALRNDLNNIIHLVEQMDKAETKDIQPLAHPLDEKQPLREDKVTEENQRSLLQSIAPKTENGLYIVPQVIESD